MSTISEQSSNEFSRANVILDKLGETIKHFESHSLSILTLSDQWRILQDSLVGVHKLFENRVKEVESKEREIEASKRRLQNNEFQERLEAVKAREEEVELKEREMDELYNVIMLKEKELNEGKENLVGQEKRLDEVNELLEGIESKEKAIGERYQVLEAKEKEFEECVRKMELKEREIGERYEVLGAKEKEFEESVKKMGLKEKQIVKRYKVLEAKEKEFEEGVREMGLKEKEFNVCLGRVEIREKVVEGKFEALGLEEKRIDEKIKGLDLREMKLNERYEMVEVKEKLIDDRERGLELKERELNECCKDLELKEKELNVHLGRVEMRETVVEGKFEALGLEEKRIKEKIKGLDLREKELNERYAMVELKEKQIDDRERGLELKERELNECRKDLELKEKEINERLEDAILKEKDIDMCLQALEPKEKSVNVGLNDLRKKLELKEKGINACCKMIESKEKEIEERFKAIEMKEKEVEKGHEALKLKENEIEECSKVIEVKKKEVMELYKAVELKRKEVKRENDALESKQMQIDERLKLKEKELNEQYQGLEEFTEKQKLRDLQIESSRSPQIETGEPRPRTSSGTSTIPSSSSGLSNDIQLLCTNMDSKGLKLYVIQNVKEFYKLDNKILDSLRLALDPAKLVLDVLQSINEVDLEKISVENFTVSLISLLIQLMKLGPEIPSHVKCEAMKFAEGWRGFLSKQENTMRNFGFLQFLASYKLAELFDSDKLVSLVVTFFDENEVYQPHKNRHLICALGLPEKIPDLVRRIILREKQLQAVRYICRFKMEKEKENASSLVYLLCAQWGYILKKVEEMLKEGSKTTQDFAVNMERIALKGVLKCIIDFKLESIYSPSPIESHIKQLEKMMADKNTTNPPSFTVNKCSEKKEGKEIPKTCNTTVLSSEKKRLANCLVSPIQEKRPKGVDYRGPTPHSNPSLSCGQPGPAHFWPNQFPVWPHQMLPDMSWPGRRPWPRPSYHFGLPEVMYNAPYNNVMPSNIGGANAIFGVPYDNSVSGDLCTPTSVDNGMNQVEIASRCNESIVIQTSG